MFGSRSRYEAGARLVDGDDRTGLEVFISSWVILSDVISTKGCGYAMSEHEGTSASITGIVISLLFS